MLEIILGGYAGLVWLLCIKLKVIPWNIQTQVGAVAGAVEREAHHRRGAVQPVLGHQRGDVSVMVLHHQCGNSEFGRCQSNQLCCRGSAARRRHGHPGCR